jgi:hypothetical protein
MLIRAHLAFVDAVHCRGLFKVESWELGVAKPLADRAFAQVKSPDNRGS